MGICDVEPNGLRFKERNDFVLTLMRERFRCEASVIRIDPLGYDPDSNLPANNFVYKVVVKPHTISCHPIEPQAGTQPIPEDAEVFIFRLSNWSSEYGSRIRIENEVAAMHLAQTVLTGRSPRLVAHVYAWEEGSPGEQGWILEEYMPGKNLNTDFKALDEAKKGFLVDQMADILQAFQEYKVPEGITEFGRLAFNKSGAVVSANHVVNNSDGPSHFWMDHGPFPTYTTLAKARIRSQLARSDDIPRIAGWRDSDIRDRLERFLECGVDVAVKDIPLHTKTFYHGDFCMANILYDPTTFQITALIDFDLAIIGTKADVFMYTMDLGLGFPTKWESEELHEAMLHSFPDPLPQSDERIDWVAAKAWDEVLRVRNMDRPATLPWIIDAGKLDFLTSQIASFRYMFDCMNGGGLTDEQIRIGGEKMLNSLLKTWGF